MNSAVSAQLDALSRLDKSLSDAVIEDDAMEDDANEDPASSAADTSSSFASESADASPNSNAAERIRDVERDLDDFIASMTD